MELLIVGVGQFGSALAKIYKQKGLHVHGIQQSDSVPSKKTPDKKRITLLCVPTQHIPEVVDQRFALLKDSYAVVSTAKGLIQASGETPVAYLRKRTKLRSLFALSGPSFASELSKGSPTALVLAGTRGAPVDELSNALSTSQLRLYKSYDVHGVEIAGAFKNVYAIAAGITEGLNLGDNARIALTTRALAEMTRIGKALGCDPLTFFGLAGAGDLFLTCTSSKSRNFQFGMGLARGKRQAALLKKLGTVEGLWTAGVAKKVCSRHHLRAPLIDTIVSILEERLSIKDAIVHLMSRKIRHEFEE